MSFNISSDAWPQGTVFCFFCYNSTLFEAVILRARTPHSGGFWWLLTWGNFHLCIGQEIDSGRILLTLGVLKVGLMQMALLV